MLGRDFGRLTVLSLVVGVRPTRWLCRCACGEQTTVRGGNLVTGKVKSCGCLVGEFHGNRSSPLYSMWARMHQRCANQKMAQWPDYGGRGIRVCARWRSFTAFVADMGARPPGGTIDRIDNDGNYEPGNCRWATRVEQGRNKRTNHMVQTGDRRVPLAEAAELTGIAASTIRTRLRRGWPEHQAVSVPVGGAR